MGAVFIVKKPIAAGDKMLSTHSLTADCLEV